MNEGAGGKGKKTYEMSHDYGSAADGLDRIALNTFTQVNYIFLTATLVFNVAVTLFMYYFCVVYLCVLSFVMA